ncbi:MAG TPA: DUF5916 domain-containing protein [Gemmatimonadaceae bacterium]|nr:DUF5916 domain-containing protein [Gemmatimonadaceae bacterium]
MDRRAVRCALAFALFAILPGVARAQQAADTNHDGAAARPHAVAVRAPSPIVIDGRLDDAAWAAARPITHFTQQRPNEAAAPTVRTEVRILYDDEALYVGARMYDPLGARGVTDRLARRDDDPQSDELWVGIDAYHDRLHQAEFDVNPAGWRGDSYDGDASWDPVWETASRVDSLGWTTELRIPFSQLHFNPESVQTWGLELVRIVQRTQERDMWAFWRQNQNGGPAFFGDLTGLRIAESPEKVELLPYVVGQAKSLGSGDTGSPFFHPHQQTLRVGGDLKYLLTSNFTLSATVNPDFGQVEVDPAVVNLSAYETFFPEKRPFFVEGSNVFSFGQPGCNINCGRGLDLFYSRRIGRPPEGAGLAYAAGPYADVPDNTTILGAGKITGHTPSGITVGVMDAVTGRSSAEVQTNAGAREDVPVEPLTNDFVGRVTQQTSDGNLVVGGMLTSVNRDITTPGLADLLPRSANVGGVDVQRYWDQHNWQAYASIAASRVAGDSGAILKLQQSPARYFQRFDRTTHPSLFSDAYHAGATSLTGYGAIARIAKQGGQWTGDLNAASVSPGFETNDLGFQQKADWKWINGSFGPQFTTPTRWYRTFSAMLGSERYSNFEGDVTQTDVTPVIQLQTLNYWNVLVVAEHIFQGVDDRATRGGPVVGRPAVDAFVTNISTDPRLPLQFSTNINLSRTAEGAFENSLSLTATVHPAPNVNLTLGPSFDRNVATDQYVATIADPTATAFDGNRYVFSHIDQRTISMTARADVTFTPGLSLDLFAQPLIASGDYSQFEEFAAPRALRKLVYGRDVGTIAATPDGSAYSIDPDGAGPAPAFTLQNPNFNFRSLRGTGVLRWEWRSGSTAYLVWTQTRSDAVPLGDLELRRDEQALLRAPADNIFLVKISYWIGR